MNKQELIQTVATSVEMSPKDVKAVLEEAGFKLSDVVKTTCFIADMNDFATFNKVYSEYFNGMCPARSCVAVKELPKQAPTLNLSDEDSKFIPEEGYDEEDLEAFNDDFNDDFSDFESFEGNSEY